MELLTSLLSWLFVKTIYGIAAVAAAVYAVLAAMRKVFPRLPNPWIAAAPIFLLGLATVPSVPRYQFEREAMAKLEGKDWVRVVNKNRWGSVTEPLTWLIAPVGSITAIMPNSPIEGGFREVTMRYEEETRVWIVDPDCSDLTIDRAAPDREGIFRSTTDSPEKMSDEEKSWYCEHDWSKEKEALRKEALRHIEAPK